MKLKTLSLVSTGMTAWLALFTGHLTARAENPGVAAATPATSTMASSGTSTKGVMFLATRGYARTSADRNNINLEAQTLHRQEFPYGASSGWKWVYQGYSDGTADSITILKAAVWVQQAPGESLLRMPLTFNGGASDVTIAKNALQETDDISTEIKPGAVVWVTTWYRAGSPATGLPFQTLLYTKETKPGAEDNDGALAGEIGKMSDHTLTGGFIHSGGKYSLTAGVGYCSRGYRPMGAIGRPHPSFKGTEIVPFFIGDSLNVQYIDVAHDDATYSMRGFNGRFCASKYPYLIFGQGGSNSGGFVAAAGTPLFTYILGDKGANKRRVTHMLNEYGINSIRMHNPPTEIAASEWADRLRVAAIAHAYGLPYIHCTLAPCEASFTGGAKDKAWYDTFVAQRQAFNNLVRTQSDNAHIPGCVGFWDWCTVFETDPVAGNNVWVAAYRSDGIHPNSAGHAAGAATIPAALLVNNPNPIPVASVAAP